MSPFPPAHVSQQWHSPTPRLAGASAAAASGDCADESDINESPLKDQTYRTRSSRSY